MMKHLTKFLLPLVAVVLLPSCGDDEPPTYPFRITVVNEEGIPIQNARVHATAPVVNAIPDFQGYTGLDGVFYNEEDNSDFHVYDLPAVLQVTAEKGNDPPVVFGCGYLKLIADSVVEMTVVLLPYNPGAAGC